MSDKAPLPDLDALIQQLRGDLFVRWMRRAQKQALIEWRDRKQFPGLAARFTRDGTEDYQFGARNPRYNRRKGGLAAFVKSGRTRDENLRRRPRSSANAGAEVVTKLAFGGGAIRFLGDVHGVTGKSRRSIQQTVTVRPYFYISKGRRVDVAASTQVRTVRQTVLTRGGPDFATEFGRFERDRPWIANRVAECFRAIMRGAALTKGGELRSNVFVEADHG